MVEGVRKGGELLTTGALKDISDGIAVLNDEMIADTRVIEKYITDHRQRSGTHLVPAKWAQCLIITPLLILLFMCMELRIFALLIARSSLIM